MTSPTTTLTLSERQKAQGWGPSEMRAQMRHLFGKEGGHTGFLLWDDFQATVGAATFPSTEAAYIRSFAGNCINNAQLPAPLGIDDDRDRRWLLSAPSRQQLHLTRQEITYFLRPHQIIKAYAFVENRP